MRAFRRTALVLFVGGLVLGSLGDDRTVPRPLQEEPGGEWILAGDFHVHAFFGDAGLAPWDLQREASRARLDVIAVTNHGGTFAGVFNAWWAARHDGPLVIPGQEVTAPTQHIIAAGVERPVDARPAASDIVRAVHDQGGVAIAAHPTRAYAAGFDDRAVAQLDGAEAAHPEMHMRPEAAQDLADFRDRATRLHPGIAAIGSSDFHLTGPLGVTRTYVIAREYSEAGVLDAIRRGQTVAADAAGDLYGEPALVSRVRAHVERHVPGRPPMSPLSRAALAMTWAGLLGMVLLDRS